MPGKPALPLLLYAPDPITGPEPAPERAGESDGPEVENHSKEEVWTAIVALGHPGVEGVVHKVPASPAWWWLRTAARHSVRRFWLDDPMRDYEDLLSEALYRLLAGERSWRREVEFKYQVARVMDSIASDWRRRAEARPEVCEAGLEPPESGEDEYPDGVLETPPHGPTIADRWVVLEKLERMERKVVVGRFGDDPEAREVLEFFRLGLDRREMQERMPRKQVRAAIERVRRRAKRVSG